jgi:hypothetical protein
MNSNKRMAELYLDRAVANAEKRALDIAASNYSKQAITYDNRLAFEKGAQWAWANPESNNEQR